MMIYPSIDQLLHKIDSKYSLVVVAARRARQLNGTDGEHVKSNARKPVAVALEEIMENSLHFRRLRDRDIK